MNLKRNSWQTTRALRFRGDFLRPLLDECFTRIEVQDTSFINCDPAGPLDRGMVAHDSPESAYKKTQKQIPQAVARIR